jgi:hypothetical protein
MEITWAVVVFLSLFFVFAARNSFKMRRFKSRFGQAFLDEIKRAYPESASLLTPDFGPQISYTLIDNKRLVKEINALEVQVAKRPEIRNKSYAHFDSGYSSETQEIIVDLLKDKIELAGKIFGCLPPKVRSLINKKAESVYRAGVEAKSDDEKAKIDRIKEEEKATHFGLDPWRFGVLMTVYDIIGRANSAAV